MAAEGILNAMKLRKGRRFAVRVPSPADSLLGCPTSLQTPRGRRSYQLLPPLASTLDYARLMRSALFIFERCLPQMPRRQLEAMVTSTLYEPAPPLRGAAKAAAAATAAEAEASGVGVAPDADYAIDYGAHRLLLLTDTYIDPKGVAHERVLGAASFLVHGAGGPPHLARGGAGGSSGAGGSGGDGTAVDDLSAGGCAEVCAFATEPDFWYCGNGRLLWDALATSLRQVGVRSAALTAWCPDGEGCEGFWVRRRFCRVRGERGGQRGGGAGQHVCARPEEDEAAREEAAGGEAANAANAALLAAPRADDDRGGGEAAAEGIRGKTALAQQKQQEEDAAAAEAAELEALLAGRGGEEGGGGGGEGGGKGGGGGGPAGGSGVIGSFDEVVAVGVVKHGVLVGGVYDGAAFWRHRHQQELGEVYRRDVVCGGGLEGNAGAAQPAQLLAAAAPPPEPRVAGTGEQQQQLQEQAGEGGEQQQQQQQQQQEEEEEEDEEGGAPRVPPYDAAAALPRRPFLTPCELSAVRAQEARPFRSRVLEDVRQAEPVLLRRWVGPDGRGAEEAAECAAALRLQCSFRCRVARRRAQRLAMQCMTKEWDHDNQVFFYHSDRTQRASWTKPWCLRGPPGLPEDEGFDLFSEAEAHAGFRLYMSWRMRQGRRAFRARLMEVWEKEWDGSRGKWVYIHKPTGTRVWSKPAILGDHDCPDVAHAAQRREEAAAAAVAAEAAHGADPSSAAGRARAAEARGRAKARAAALGAAHRAREAALRAVLQREEAHFWALLLLSISRAAKAAGEDAGIGTIADDPDDPRAPLHGPGAPEGGDVGHGAGPGPRNARFAVQEAIEMLKCRRELAASTDPSITPARVRAANPKKPRASRHVHKTKAARRAMERQLAARREAERRFALEVSKWEAERAEGGYPDRPKPVRKLVEGEAEEAARMADNAAATVVGSFPLHFLCPDPLATAGSVAYAIGCFPAATRMDDIRTGMPPLHLICGNGALDLAMINEVMEAGADFSRVDTRSGRTPLHVLADNPALSMLTLNYVLEAAPEAARTQAQVRRHLPARQAIANNRFAGCYPLHLLCRNPSLTLALWRRLLKAHPPAGTHIAREGNILHFACKNPCMEDDLLEKLIDHFEPNLRAPDDLDGKNPLHNMCLNEAVNRDMLERVVDGFPEACALTRGGYSPLQCMCMNPKFTIDMMDLIIAHAPESVHVDTHCDPALFLLCGNPNVTRHAMERLIDCKPSSVFYEINGETALHRLVENPKLTLWLLRLLLAANEAAAAQMEQYTGRYALHRLCANPALDPEWLWLLLEANPLAATHPTGTMFDRTDAGRYPAHNLCANVTLQKDWAWQLLDPLIKAHPGALSERDDAGDLPVHGFLRQARERGEVAEAVDNNSFYYRDKMLDKLKLLTTLPLKALTTMDCVNVLDGLDLFQFCSGFYKAKVTGRDMYYGASKLCDEHEIYGPSRIRLCDKVAEFKETGVPLRFFKTKEYTLNLRAAV